MVLKTCDILDIEENQNNLTIVIKMGFILSDNRRKYSNLISLILAFNLLLALILEMCCVGVNAKLSQQQYEDNEFAEFEELDDDLDAINQINDKINQNSLHSDQQNEEVLRKNTINKDSDETESTLEDEEDDEEFENVSDFDESNDKKESIERSNNKKPDLKITSVPLHLRSNWESYYFEFLMIAGLVVYFINFITGRNKNQKMADTWFDVHKELLYSNFALVGDDGKKEIENAGLIKETESVFTLWCSGRVCVEGMLVELRFLKRQDLVNVISRYIKPALDQIVRHFY